MAPTQVEQPRQVLVVGGGVAGLAAAYALLDDPTLTVTIVDAGAHPGGKLQLAEVAGIACDVGAEAVLATRPEAVQLMTELAPGDVVAPATTAARIWSRGRLYPLPRTRLGVPYADTDLTGLLTSQEIARADTEQWGTSLDGDVSVAAAIGSRLGPAIVDRLVDPLLGGVYAGRADQLSVQATMPMVWADLVAGHPLRPIAPVGVTARAPFASLVGGLGRLPRLLSAAIADRGGRIEVGTIVRSLTRGPQGWSVVSGPACEPQRHDADAVVIATAPSPTARLLADVDSVAAQQIAGIETASVVTIVLALPREQLHEFPGSGFLVPAVDGRHIKGATLSSAKWSWLARRAEQIAFVRLSLGRHGETSVLHRDDDELVALSVADLEKAMSRKLTVLDSGVQRWGGALPQYHVGHLDRVSSAMSAMTRHPGLEIAGAAYHGVGVPAAIGSGQDAASRVRTYLQTQL